MDRGERMGQRERERERERERDGEGEKDKRQDGVKISRQQFARRLNVFPAHQRGLRWGWAGRDKSTETRRRTI